MKISYISLQNFKCHKDLKIELTNLNILTGSNATGKSSLLQGLLLAHNVWKNHEGKSVSPNNFQGLNLGIPSNIVYEEFPNSDVILDIGINGEKNEVILCLFDNEMFFYIENAEEIAEKISKFEHLGKMNMFFINAERQGPRLISNINDSNWFSVGNRGENTSYVISEIDKVQKLDERLRLPSNLKISTIDRFSANCEEWLKLVIPDTELQYNTDIEKNIATIKFRNSGEYYLPTATGFGITYVLPIIVQALVASIMKNSVLIVENPEAHLHPYSQSILGKFLALVAENNVQVIVETHSEHIIDGARIQASKDQQYNNMQVLFFEKCKGSSTYKKISVQENGELEDWPRGFFDQKQLDLKELLEMRRCGK